MRMTAMALIFLFGLVAIFAAYLSHSLVILQRYAVVDAVQGTADLLVHGRGKPVPLQVGRLVRAGDVVRTGRNSSVELRWVRWVGGMRIKIGPETRFTVKKATVNRSTKEEESRLRVDLGRIWVRLRQALRGRSKFEVETPTVVAAVRGTVFSVLVDAAGASRVQVYEGQVSIKGASGAAATLSAASETTVSAEQRALETRPLTPAQLEQWQDETSIVGPFLEVSRPTDGERLAGDSVPVAGRTEPGVVVLADGHKLEVSESGEFSSQVALKPGAAALTITARDAAGRQSTVRRALSAVSPVSARSRQQR
jgi:hypothetical protein